MARTSLGRSGLVPLVVLPWALAGIGLAVAAAGWVARGPSGLPGSAPPSDPGELRSLRLALATATAENTALRGELDRLVGRGRAAGPARSAAGEASASAAPSGPSAEERAALSARISEALSRAAVGDPGSAREGAVAMMQALQHGPAAAEALREAYVSTGDPKARMMMLPTLLFAGGDAARDFVVAQAKTETDPELKRALLSQVAGFATPRYAGELKDTFLETIESEDDPEIRGAAIRGLRYARGEEVQEALLRAVNDPSEDVRLAAVENLAARPGLRKKLRELLAADPSSDVREVGECRLLLAESLR